MSGWGDSGAGQLPSAGGVAARRAGRADVADLVGVLVRAFEDDPVSTYLFPRRHVRRRGLRRFFRIQLRRLFVDTGEIWTTSDRLGAALWVPPGATHPASWRDLVVLAPVLADLVAGGRPAASLRLLAEVERVRPSEPHWYLATLGTDPPAQGHGVGSALLEAVLATVDEQHLPAYLESSKEANISFYTRHGFEVTGEIRSDDGGVTLWPMWRRSGIKGV